MGARDSANRWIQPAEYQPPRGSDRRSLLPGLALIAGLAGFAAVAVTLWFVLTLRAVEIRIEPQPERVSLSGLTFRLAENWLARPGRYTVRAEKPGYHDLEAEITVTSDGDARFGMEMRPLPGRLTFTGTPDTATILIDEEPIGQAPIREHSLEPGQYRLAIEADGFQPWHQPLEVEGRDIHQEIGFELVPDHAEVTITSVPEAAEIRVDGEPVANTPATIRAGIGQRVISLQLEGFRSWSERFEIEGGVALEIGPVELDPAPASLTIVSEPEGAVVTIDGQRRGRAPLRIELEPDQEVSIGLAMEGYQPLNRRFTPQADVASTLRGELVPIIAELEVFSEPVGAQLQIDGRQIGPVGADGLTLELPARQYRLELSLEGHVTETREVRLDPDQPVRVAVELMTELEARIARLQPLIRAGDGQTLKLVEPGRFTMGSPRGEQGRRANELQREVRLERLFYMGTHEVTNEQFRRFRPNHSSGIAGNRTLDNEEQPVVRVSFDDAAAYANWLSERDGLEPAYRRMRDGYRLVEPVTTGYRLPSEAEWAWVARFAGDRDLRYPWGEGFPPPDGAGNYADRSAAGLLPVVLEAYDDGFPATGQVGSFQPNALGFHDLGGNVSEWTGDAYRIALNETPGLEVDPVDTSVVAERVVRGSSWRHAGLTELRLAWRDRASEGRDDLGFRLVRYAE
ncbi:MAG: PEGA domain-containing protein [Wenzhouxiangellaceae bacterium]